MTGGDRRSAWTPERRAAHGAKTKERMADPAVRARIVEGMRTSDEALLKQIKSLHTAWIDALPAARSRFLRELLSPLFARPNDRG